MEDIFKSRKLFKLFKGIKKDGNGNLKILNVLIIHLYDKLPP